jgi:predicted AAA+ superfamily ATPase
LLDRVHQALKRSRVVPLIGPRQCGKTTLARQIVPANTLVYFDLENPRGIVAIDQVQR